MPLFTVTTKSNGSISEKDGLSRAIHAASTAAGYPEDDLFQRFLSLGPSDFVVDLYYPALPKPRSDQILVIEVMVSSGTDTNWNKGLVAALVEKLGEAGIDPNEIMVLFLETDRASGLIRWRPVRTACCLRLINALGILATWLRRTWRRSGHSPRSRHHPYVGIVRWSRLLRGLFQSALAGLYGFKKENGGFSCLRFG